MKLKVPPRVASRALPPVIGTLAASWRYHTSGDDAWRRLQLERVPLVFVLWHEVMLPLLWHHRHQGHSIVVSEARDGQYLADYACRLGFHPVRGSSTRGGIRALLGAVRVLEQGGSVAFTPDGPRGPRRVMKPGAVVAAQRGGAAIVPVHASARSAWRLRSWDRFCVPKPFTRVDLRYSTPVPVGDGEAGIARGVREVTEALEGMALEMER